MRNLAILCCVLALAVPAIAGEVVLDPAEFEGNVAKIIPSSRVSPEYPPAALDARFSGTVILAAVINDDGTVGAVDVMDCSMPKLGFEENAIEAIKQWRFEPAEKNGIPVTSVAAYSLHFEVPEGGVSDSAYVSGYHLASTIVGRQSFKVAAPSRTLKGEGFSPSARIGKGLQSINIPPDALCERCIYSREGVIPARRRGGYSRPNRD